MRTAGVDVAGVDPRHQSADILLGYGPPTVRVREDVCPWEGRAVARGGTTVLTVAGTGFVVEVELGAGRLSCPGCSGRLSPWGHARERQVRIAAGWCWVRPRRSRCSGCGGTHVLLPVLCLLRRVYSAEVILSALTAKATSGWGWRRVAALVGVPEMTVRGWLRCFAARAESVRVFFTRAGLSTGIDLCPAAPNRDRYFAVLGEVDQAAGGPG